MKNISNVSLAALLVAVLTAGAFAQVPSDIQEMAPIKRGAYTFYPPYLDGGIEAMGVVPAPPVAGSEAAEADRRAALKNYDPARVAQATQDTRISPAYFANIFGAAIGEEISAQRTPAIYALLGRSIADYGLSTSDAKRHYMRTRPFAEYGLPSCSPYAEDELREDGSYPSGHTAVGFGLSLVMASVAPEHRDSLLARGKDYAHSRVVCKVHYPSDIDAGMTVAEAVLEAQLRDAQFRVDLQAARAEWRSLERRAGRPAMPTQ